MGENRWIIHQNFIVTFQISNVDTSGYACFHHRKFHFAFSLTNFASLCTIFGKVLHENAQKWMSVESIHQVKYYGL